MSWFAISFLTNSKKNSHHRREYDCLLEYYGKMNSVDRGQLWNPDRIADAFIQLVSSENLPAKFQEAPLSTGQKAHPTIGPGDVGLGSGFGIKWL